MCRNSVAAPAPAPARHRRRGPVAFRPAREWRETPSRSTMPPSRPRGPRPLRGPRTESRRNRGRATPSQSPPASTPAHAARPDESTGIGRGRRGLRFWGRWQDRNEGIRAIGQTVNHRLKVPIGRRRNPVDASEIDAANRRIGGVDQGNRGIRGRRSEILERRTPDPAVGSNQGKAQRLTRRTGR